MGVLEKEETNIYVRLLAWTTRRMDGSFSEIGRTSEGTGLAVQRGNQGFILDVST